MNITNANVFYAVSAIIIGYILYMMVRKRKGERPDTATREPEL